MVSIIWKVMTVLFGTILEDQTLSGSGLKCKYLDLYLYSIYFDVG